MNADLDRVLDKIKKCLALANSAEPHEAAAAMRQAQKLMDKYNVDHSDVEQAEVGELLIRSRVSVSRCKPWEMKFMQMIARAYGCLVLWTPSNSHYQQVFGTWRLVGLKSQLKLAEYVAEVLMRRLVKQRAEFVRILPGYLDRIEKAVEGDGFASGWVQSVSQTVVEFSRTEEIKPRLDKYVDTTFGKDLENSKSQKREVGDLGYNAGHAAGSKEQLNRPVDGFTMKRLS